MGCFAIIQHDNWVLILGVNFAAKRLANKTVFGATDWQSF
jgi:hypothetical protein